VDGQNVAFGVISAVMAVAAIAVVTVRNVVHAALALVMVLAGVAAQYILLQAEFVAWVQVLIYIGAVIVLFLFGIMLTRAPMRKSRTLDNNQRIPALLVAALILGVLAFLLGDTFGTDEISEVSTGARGQLDFGSTASIGESMFRSWVIPFEVVSMLLLAALVGAIVLARRD
jgi:NADH-quinone oxidoreductase subunit J